MSFEIFWLILTPGQKQLMKLKIKIMVFKSRLSSVIDESLSKISTVVSKKITRLTLGVQCECVGQYAALHCGNPIGMARNGVLLQNSNFFRNDLADFAQSFINDRKSIQSDTKILIFYSSIIF